MLIAIYQLLLFGIGPIRKRVLHWLEEASDATDFKPYIINSELYMGITCVIPFVYVLILAIVSKFMNDESVATILNWEYRVSFIVGVCHLFIFFEWLITDMHFAPVIFILLVVLALGFLIGISYPSNLVMAAIFGAAFIFTFITLLTTAILFKSIPESESPWTQIYTNDVNASVVIDYGENHKVTAGDILGTYGEADLNYGTDKFATVVIKNGDDESRRKVIVSRIDGDIDETSAITKIEYRPTPTFHYQLFGMNGKSQTSNFDGEIRITVSRKENSANTIFGD